MNPRYRQLGYGFAGTDLGWRAVWLDAQSVNTGNLVTVQYLSELPNPEPVPYYGTIYRTLSDMLDAVQDAGDRRSSAK